MDKLHYPLHMAIKDAIGRANRDFLGKSAARELRHALYWGEFELLPLGKEADSLAQEAGSPTVYRTVFPYHVAVTAKEEMSNEQDHT